MNFFKQRLLTGINIALALCFCASTVLAKETGHRYSFGIVPQQAASKLARDWGPFLKKVEQLSGVSLSFKTAPTIPDFERRMAAGEYDFAYMNPYHYVVFSDQQEYRAFAKQKDKLITGILVTAKDSPVKGLEDLRGENLAFPSSGAFAASILTRAALKKQGIEFTPSYVGSHDSVYLNVASGRFLAGGGIFRTYNASAENVREKTRVLWTSNGYTPHAFAAHGRVEPEVVKVVAQALIELVAHPDGLALLKNLGFNKGIVAAQDQDWDDVRGLGVNSDSVISNLKKTE